MPNPFRGLRVLQPVRNQLDMFPGELDLLVAPDHPVRAVWKMVCGFDLSPFVERIKAREGEAGRPPIDPRILLALWVFAHFENVGSAYELERACERDVVYRWIRGGVPVDRKTLSNFRTGNFKAVNKLLTQLVAMLMRVGLIQIDRLAADGLKIRACAGAEHCTERPRSPCHGGRGAPPRRRYRRAGRHSLASSGCPATTLE